MKWNTKREYQTFQYPMVLIRHSEIILFLQGAQAFHLLMRSLFLDELTLNIVIDTLRKCTKVLLNRIDK